VCAVGVMLACVCVCVYVFACMRVSGARGGIKTFSRQESVVWCENLLHVQFRKVVF